MKNARFSLVVFLALMLAVSSCTSAPTLEPVHTVMTTTEPATEPAPDAPAVLTVVGPEGEYSFSLAELQALPSTSGQAGMKSSTG